MNIDEVSALVAQCAPVPPACVRLDSHLIEDFGYDSVNFIELLVAIEQTFHIALADEHLDMRNFETPQAILMVLLHYQQQC
jgi:acyl carrier protein